jgi:hypothetical protein
MPPAITMQLLDCKKWGDGQKTSWAITLVTGVFEMYTWFALCGAAGTLMIGVLIYSCEIMVIWTHLASLQVLQISKLITFLKFGIILTGRIQANVKNTGRLKFFAF